ncbi:hypothetical protein HDV05_000503 [Chytridiales sp. JEL 0842]|nr:hypothetical protein HDV05_000503 [Chytridiales sp. JEL 0842]
MTSHIPLQPPPPPTASASASPSASIDSSSNQPPLLKKARGILDGPRGLKFNSLLDFPSGLSPSPLPTIEQTPNRFLASCSTIDFEPNPFEQSFSSTSGPAPEPPSGYGFSLSPKPILPPLTGSPRYNTAFERMDSFPFTTKIGAVPMPSPKILPPSTDKTLVSSVSIGGLPTTTYKSVISSMPPPPPPPHASSSSSSTATPPLSTSSSPNSLSTSSSNNRYNHPHQQQEELAHPAPFQEASPPASSFDASPDPYNTTTTTSNAQHGFHVLSSAALAVAETDEATLAKAQRGSWPSSAPRGRKRKVEEEVAAEMKDEETDSLSEKDEDDGEYVETRGRGAKRGGARGSTRKNNAGRTTTTASAAATTKRGGKGKSPASASLFDSVSPSPPTTSNKRAKSNNSSPSVNTTRSTSLAPSSNASNASDSEDKRKSFLERNRIAALKCRQKKKQWMESLQSRVESLTSENTQLQLEAKRLREEVAGLKRILLGHKDCAIARGNGLHVEAIEATLGGR